MTHPLRLGAAVVIVVAASACAAATEDAAPTTTTPATSTTTTTTPTSTTTTTESCDEQCRFPTFARATDPLTAADDGNCNAALAAEYGGDCTNFQWLGQLGDPSVMYEDGRYTMWFTAGERTTAPGEDPSWWPVIARSTSDDGVLWSDVKDIDRDIIAVLSGGTEGLDSVGVETIHVDRDPDGGYVAYYSGGLGQEPSAIYVIGRATSPDGVRWTKSSEPVMVAELPWEQTFDAGGFDIGGVLEPTVIHEDGRWRMWYVGFGEEPGTAAYSRIGYAESTDGITWTKRPDPVFSGGDAEFETLGVSHADVVADPRGGYHLFYVGIGADERLRMGHAYSEDGFTWERNPANPIIAGEPGEFDEGLVGGPSAVFVGDELQLFYMGTTKPDFSEPVRFLRTVAIGR